MDLTVFVQKSTGTIGDMPNGLMTVLLLFLLDLSCRYLESEMSAIYGKAIGEEARYREKDVLLGPGVNIYRTPLNGRNFEYMGKILIWQA